MHCNILLGVYKKITLIHFFLFIFVNIALSSNEGFILNGDYVVSMFKKEIKIGNAVIEYSGSDTPIERINSTYRIDQEIVLQVKRNFFF